MNNKIGKYEIVGKIGEGGMGSLYKAKHPTLRRLVILKQLTLGSNINLIERFKREARLMIDFRDENIVQVYDHFKEGDSYFIVMEFVDGISLDKLIKEKRYLSNDAAILIFNEVCKGLKYAHDRDVIHRDIKPANILISKEGDIKLTDFGIATSKEDEDEGLTRAGTTLGTPAFMPPEQINNIKNVDKRADIYAMGVMLYNMVTGKLPFPGNISPETIMRIEKGKYSAPKEFNPKVSGKVQEIIRKSIKSKKEKRYGDLNAVIAKFQKDLRRFQDEKVIKEAIKKYIHGKEVSLKWGGRITNQKENIGLIPSFYKIGIAVILVSFIIGFAAFKNGIFYELLFNKQYGALKINVEVPKEYTYIKEKSIDVEVFYKDERGRYIEKNNVNFNFKKNKKLSTGRYNYYESGKVYLKDNLYDINVSVKNEKHQNNIYLEPIVIQKKNNGKEYFKKINVRYSMPPSFPIYISFSFKDLDTKKIWIMSTFISGIILHG